MKTLHPVDSASFRQQSWANGKGRTTQLAAGPDPEHWSWRISMAHVDEDGAFSVLPGVRRQLAPLDGALELHFANGECMLGKRLKVLAFDGGRKIECHLLDGPGRDLNLMLRDGVQGELMTRPLVGSMVLPARQGRWFILQLTGQAMFTASDETLALAAGSALWLHPQAGVRTHIDGSGEIALIHLDDAPAPGDTAADASGS